MSVCKNESQFRKMGDGEREREGERERQSERERERDRVRERATETERERERERKRGQRKEGGREECINTDDTPTERTSAGLETTARCR